eukprot:793008_1
MWIINQSLPADSGARFLKVNAHHHEHVVLQVTRNFSKFTRISERGFHIVNGTRPDDTQQAVILAVYDTGNLLSRLENVLDMRTRHRKLSPNKIRSEQCTHLFYTNIHNS